MTFQKGESGNPAGRPRGIRDQRTLLAEQLLEGDTDAIVRKAIELAKAGDSTALRLCIERICPNLRQRPVMFELPPMQRAASAIARGKRSSSDLRCLIPASMFARAS